MRDPCGKKNVLDIYCNNVILVLILDFSFANITIWEILDKRHKRFFLCYFIYLHVNLQLFQNINFIFRSSIILTIMKKLKRVNGDRRLATIGPNLEQLMWNIFVCELEMSKKIIQLHY